MYLSQLTIRNFRQFGDGDAELNIVFNQGVTALVGRNDCGKSAVVDAIRYALLTRADNFVRVQPEDFHIDAEGQQASDILIHCKLAGLDENEKGSFVEYLTYDEKEVVLFLNWTAKRIGESPSARRWVDISIRSGKDASGPQLESSARDLLKTAYLRPLRDAEREMSSGRGSRLSQILAKVPEIQQGTAFDKDALPADTAAVANLSLLGLADYLRHSIKEHEGVQGAETSINKQYISSLFLAGDDLKGRIDITEGGSDQVRLRQILERLELALLDGATGSARGLYGLGSNNLLFMACELLLLGNESEGLPLLLIEEPEAHLHPQRQLRLMDFLSKATSSAIKDANRAVQVILTTHSPNIASKVPLENLVVLEGSQAFSLAPEFTKLEKGDYRLLQRLLDVTKANLFFAHGVIIVEGVAEAILIPVLAELIGRDLTNYGVSIVNVGGTGLKRYSRIFQRADNGDKAPKLSVPVACLADMDVMPNSSPEILGLVSGANDAKWTSGLRRWKVMRDFDSEGKVLEQELFERRRKLQSDDGQSVRTFVGDHWTLEYDLAFCGLAEEVYVAASLAKNDDSLNDERKARMDVEDTAKLSYQTLAAANTNRAKLCTHIYKLFHSGGALKAVGAQYLADMLTTLGASDGFVATDFKNKLPSYIVDAIVYATGASFEHLAQQEKDDA